MGSELDFGVVFGMEECTEFRIDGVYSEFGFGSFPEMNVGDCVPLHTGPSKKVSNKMMITTSKKKSSKKMTYGSKKATSTSLKQKDQPSRITGAHTRRITCTWQGSFPPFSATQRSIGRCYPSSPPVP